MVTACPAKRLFVCLLILLMGCPPSLLASPCSELVHGIVSNRFDEFIRETPFHDRAAMEKALANVRKEVEETILKQCKTPADCTAEKLDPILTETVTRAMKNVKSGVNWRPLGFFAVGVGVLLVPLISAYGVQNATGSEFMGKLAATLITLSVAETARVVFTVALRPVHNRLEQWGYQVRSSKTVKARANSRYEQIFHRALELYSDFGRQGRSVEKNTTCLKVLSQVLGLQTIQLIRDISVDEGSPIPMKDLVMRELPHQIADTVAELHDSYDEVSLSSRQIADYTYRRFTSAQIRNRTLSPDDIVELQSRVRDNLFSRHYPDATPELREYFEDVLRSWFTPRDEDLRIANPLAEAG